MWDRMIAGLTTGSYTTFRDTSLSSSLTATSNRFAYLSGVVRAAGSVSIQGNPLMFNSPRIDWGQNAALTHAGYIASIRLLTYHLLRNFSGGQFTNAEALAYTGSVFVTFRGRVDTRFHFLGSRGTEIPAWSVPAGINVSGADGTIGTITAARGIQTLIVKGKDGDPIGWRLNPLSGNAYHLGPTLTSFNTNNFIRLTRAQIATMFNIDLSFNTIMSRYLTGNAVQNIRGLHYTRSLVTTGSSFTLEGAPPKYRRRTEAAHTNAAGILFWRLLQDRLRQSLAVANNRTGTIFYTTRAETASNTVFNPWLTALTQVSGTRFVVSAQRAAASRRQLFRINNIVIEKPNGNVGYYKYITDRVAIPYQEASATEILNELEPLPTATAGTFSVATKSLSLTSSGSGTFDIEAATGGRGTVAYSLVSPPTGITLSGRTVTVAGSVAANASISITARATWSLNQTTATADSTFTLALARTQAPSAGSFTVSAKTVNPTHDGSSTFMLDAATGGTGTVTYTLVSPPAGITISGRTVTVAASVARNPSVSLTARATWTTPEGSRSVTSTFNLNVNRAFPPAVVGTFTLENTHVTMPTTGSGTVTLAAATGGVGTITYALQGTVPTGITLSGRTLSVQQVVTDGPKALTVRATWTSGTSTATTDRSFTLTVRRPLRYADQDEDISHGETFTLPVATLGTPPYTYELGAESPGTPSTDWGTPVTHNISVPSVLGSYTRPVAFATDPTDGTVYMAVKTSATVFTLYTLDPSNNYAPTTVGAITGMHSRYTNGRLSISFTPSGKLYALRVPFVTAGNAGTLAVYELNKSTGAVSSTVNGSIVLPNPRYSSFNMFSETQAYITVYNSSTISIMTVATGAVTATTQTLPRGVNNAGVGGVAFYDNKLFFSETFSNSDVAWRDVGTGTQNREPRRPYPQYGITFVGRNYITADRVNATTLRIYVNPATDGSDYEPFVEGNLPTGITYNKTTRVISVASTAKVGDHALILRVRDSITPPETVFADIDITVVAIPMPALPTINNIDFRDGEGDTTHTLPEAQSGVGAKTYTLTLQDGSALPAELSFNAATRVLTIHDNEVDIGDGTFNLRYTATDTNSNTDTKDFNVRVLEPYAVAGTLSVTNRTLNLSSSSAGNFSIEAAVGGLGVLEYQLVNPPAGINMPDSSNRVVTIAGNVAAGVYNLTARASWESGGRDAEVDSSFTVTITRTQAPAVGVFSQTDKSISVTSSEVENVALSAATGGTGTITYSLVSPPTGVTLSGTTLTVANTVGSGDYNITVRATWTTVEGSLSEDASFKLTVTRTLAPEAGTFTQTNRRLSLRLTNAGSLSIDTASGGVGTVSYSLTSPPAGISLSGTTLSVAATYAAQTQNITVVATWTTAEGSRSLSATFELVVTRSAAPAVVGTFAPTDKALSLSSSGTGTFTVEAASGGTGTISYSLVSPPPGITMSGRVVTVAGTVTANNNISITVRATWTLGTETATLDRTIKLNLARTLAPATGTFSVPTQTRRASWNGSATFTLPVASGGTGSITYNLQSPVPSGVTIGANRVVTIAASRAAGDFSLTARATWTTVEGSVHLDSTFTVAFSRAPRPAERGSFSVGNRTFNFSHTEAGTFEIPAATGGVGEIQYGLISAPAGITISGRVVTIAGTVPAGVYRLTARALWLVTDPQGPDSSVFLDSTFTITLTRPPVASAGTFNVGTKVLDLAPDHPGSVELDAPVGGVGSVSYELVTAPQGFTLQGRFITVAADIPAGSSTLVVRAIWTSGPTTASAEATFLLTVNRVGAALQREPVRLTNILQRVRLRLARRGSKVVIKESVVNLSEFASPSAAASYDVSDMVIYNEVLKVSYQYEDASGVALNPEPIDIPTSDWELVEGDVLLSVEGQNLVYDNRLSGATRVRVTFDSTIKPNPVKTNTIPNLTAEKLQEELTKRDLQDAYVLRSGSVDPGTVHGDNIVDGSIRGSKLATNSLSSDTLAQGAVTTAKLATGSVTAAKLARGLLYTPGVSDPNNLSTLDLTQEADGSENTGDWVFIANNGTAKKLTWQNYHDDTGIPIPENQLGRYALGLVRTRVGADVRIATVEGAIVTGLSGLVAGRAYSLADDGTLRVWEQGHYQVGVALSTSRLMLRRG